MRWLTRRGVGDALKKKKKRKTPEKIKRNKTATKRAVISFQTCDAIKHRRFFHGKLPEVRLTFATVQTECGRQRTARREKEEKKEEIDCDV